MRWLFAFFVVWACAAQTARIGTATVQTISTGVGASPDIYGPADTWLAGTDLQFTMEFVTVDDPGNPPHPSLSGGYSVGDVDYTFRMQRYTVSEHQFNNLMTGRGISGITASNIGTNKPAGRLCIKEIMWWVNALNTAKGYHPAYNIDQDGTLAVWPEAERWRSTNGFRHKDCGYALPTVHEHFKAAMWDKAEQVWHYYGQGTDDAPTPVNGYWHNGSTNAGTAVYLQHFDERYPEWNSTNQVNVTLTVDGGGAITAVAYDSFIRGHSLNQSTSTPYVITQGARTAGRARVGAYSTLLVPAEFAIVNGGTGYSDREVVTLTLGAEEIECEAFAIDGAVVGLYPLGKRWTPEDYTTVIDVVGTGAGAAATCIRYSTTYVPDSFVVTTASTLYSAGAATMSLGATDYSSYYVENQGAADVDRAGGPSPFGAVGMFGNASNLLETPVDFGSDMDDAEEPLLYVGFWWFRVAASNLGLGNEFWRLDQCLTGAYANSFRVVSLISP